MNKPLPLSGLRVLVVEDMFLIAEEIGHLLSEWGCEVIGPASNLRSALHFADLHEIDAALLDVNLGGEMVFPVAEVLAARNIPFLFLSAYSTASAFPPMFQDIPRVGKPFGSTVLEKTMTETLLIARRTPEIGSAPPTPSRTERDFGTLFEGSTGPLEN